MYTNPKLLKYAIAGLTVIGIFLAMISISVPQERVISFGIDNYENHRALYGNNVLSQQATTKGQLVGIGMILVDLRKAEHLVDVEVVIRDAVSNQPLGQTVIPANTIKDDEFATARFPTILNTENESIIVELTAPQARDNNALGVRYNSLQSDSNNPRYENGNLKSGTLAMNLIEKVTLWRYFATNINQYPQLWLRSLAAVFVVIIVSLFASKTGSTKLSLRQQSALRLGVVICLAGLALNSYLSVISHFKGVSGGDPYNYLFITDSISHLQNPFENTKRLPGYPLLLLPAYSSQNIDDILSMRVFSAISAAASVIVLSLLARALGLPALIQLAAPLLLAWQKDFLWTATRPEPYSFYTLLLLSSLLLFLKARRPWQQILYGLLLGYAAMTRQEGFVLAAVLGSVSLVRSIYFLLMKKDSGRNILYGFGRMYLPALLIVAPFFANNFFHFGNPVYTPYFEGDRLQIVDSWGAFKDSLGATWGVIGSTWRPSWDQLSRYKLTSNIFLLTFLFSIIWTTPWSKLVKKFPGTNYITAAMAALILLFVILTGIFSPLAFKSTAPAVVAALLLISPFFFVWKTGASGLLVLIVLISQILIATWFHPFAKHFQQSYPLIALMLATIVVAPILSKKEEVGNLNIVMLSSAWLPAFIILLTILFSSLGPFIDKANTSTALDSVAYRAVQVARRLPTPYGIAQQHLPAQLYLKDGLHLFGDSEATKQQEQTWLEDNNIKTLIVINDLPIFDDLSGDWKEVSRFKSEGKDEKVYESFVYQRQ